jgi:RHS repeat-associated protein
MPNGAEYTYQYDVIGKITAITAPEGMSKKFVYDEKGNLAKEVDQSNREISYTYDKMHRLLDTINPNGGKLSYTYDTNGNVSNVVTPMGYKKSFEYDALDRITKELDPVGKVTEYNYDVLGKIEKMTVNGGRVTTYSYDNVGNLTSSTNPLNQTTAMKYDAMNRMTQQIDAAGKAMSYEYDFNGQLTTLTDKKGATTKYSYDKQGNLTSKIDALNRKTSYAYDLLNRVVGVTDANNVETRYAYDTVGNMTSRVDGAGRTTNYTFDLANRMTSITNPLQEVQKMKYDLNGNLSEFTNPDGTKIQYDYDKLDGLVSKKSSEDATGQALYGYDKDGRKISMSDVAGTTKYEYDEIGRITSAALSTGGKIGYTYDSYGNLTKLSYPDGTSVTYQYDELDRLIGIVDRTNQKTSYTYDLSGNLTEVVRPNETSSTMQYDEMGNIIKLENKNKGVVSSFEYTYDMSGTIIKEIATQGKQKITREFTYDNLGQIINIDETNGKLTTSYTYTYDQVGNRIKEQEKRGNNVVKDIANVFNGADRLVKSENTANWETKRTTYEYDKNGNMIKKNMPYDSYMTYKYDNENRLTAIRDKQNLLFAALYDGNGDRIFSVTPKYNTGGWHDDGNNGGWQVNSSTKNYGTTAQTSEKVDISSKYKVNYNQKLVDETMLIPNGVNQWGKEQYELTGYINNINTQNTQVLMEYGFDGKIGNSYDYGLNRNSIISKNKKNYYAYDGRGSVSELLNSQGNVSMGYSYGAFGKTTTTTNLYVDNPYQYNAEYVDSIPGVPGMQYLRARYYSPYEGRFFSQDTVFGDMLNPLSQNLYAYCQNNPIMFQDPSGRYQVPASIQMAGPAAVASYLAGMKKNDPCVQAQATVNRKKQEAELANKNANNPLYSSTSSSSSSSDSNYPNNPLYQSTSSSSSNSWSSGIDYGQAEAQRQAEEARRQAEIEKKKREANFKTCTDLINFIYTGMNAISDFGFGRTSSLINNLIVSPFIDIGWGTVNLFSGKDLSYGVDSAKDSVRQWFAGFSQGDTNAYYYGSILGNSESAVANFALLFSGVGGAIRGVSKGIKVSSYADDVLRGGSLVLSGEIAGALSGSLEFAGGVAFGSNTLSNFEKDINIIKESNTSKGDIETTSQFENRISRLSPEERVAAVKEKARQVAQDNGLIKDSKLSRINDRNIYRNPNTGDYYSVDTQHGRFEYLDKRGRHKGEMNFDFNVTKPADITGGHNITVK